MNEVMAYFDGGAWPNPNGKAYYGFIITRKGKRLTHGHAMVGSGKGMSNNVAEYAGFLAAMRWLVGQKMHKEPIIFKGDSMLVIKQMSRKWGFKGGYYAPFYLKARELQFKFINAKYQWIPREQNERADYLAYLKQCSPQCPCQQVGFSISAGIRARQEEYALTHREPDEESHPHPCYGERGV